MCPVVDFGGGILCTFVESLQRQYKDRSSNGTCVFRMVSASFFILRMWIIPKSYYYSWSSSYQVFSSFQLLSVCMVLQGGHTNQTAFCSYVNLWRYLWIMLTFWSNFWLHGMLSCVTSHSSPKHFTYMFWYQHCSYRYLFHVWCWYFISAMIIQY